MGAVGCTGEESYRDASADWQGLPCQFANLQPGGDELGRLSMGPSHSRTSSMAIGSSEGESVVNWTGSSSTRWKPRPCFCRIPVRDPMSPERP